MQQRLMIHLLFLSTIYLSGCSDNGILFRSVGSYQTNTQSGGFYMMEKPYELDGVTYTPAEDYNYFDSGDAFWYEADEAHAITANGERNDATRYTAMHRTLPLPSIVRITNLKNHTSVLVRVNDRGPQDPNRLIDVSKPVATYLNFSKTEVTPVQVEIMVAESKALKERLLKQKTTLSKTFENQKSDKTQGEVVVNADSILYPGMSEKDIRQLKVSSKMSQKETSKAVSLTNSIDETLNLSDDDIIYSGSNESMGTYYIQIGAFSRQESVNNIRKKLSDYKNLFVLNKMKNGQLLHHVRVGPFSTRTQAQKMLDKIHGTGYVESKIVQD